VNKFNIPTTYRGVRFRSRLEARYAVFFDEVGWPWQYEPIDLIGYIPDFILGFEQGDVLFEVKGSVEEEDTAKAKIEASGWSKEAVVAPGDIAGTRLGSLLEANLRGFEWSDADLFFCISCGQVSLHSGNGSWHCRRCGESEGHVGVFDPRPAMLAASNRVQYRRTA
jgi:ribosomal protein L37AE/L43A